MEERGSDGGEGGDGGEREVKERKGDGGEVTGRRERYTSSASIALLIRSLHKVSAATSQFEISGSNHW